jgi:adenosylcobinamide kinase/adenosylcobinamide-phosphate guanylyltransferase
LSNNIVPSVLKNLTLIAGGARSGKSAFAERLASSRTGQVVYLATMGVDKSDSESKLRIQIHRERRPDNWITIEETESVPKCLDKLPGDTQVCLIDCLSLWVSNLLLKEATADTTLDDLKQIQTRIHTAVEELLLVVETKLDTTFIVVTSEVGSGLVPENKLARVFCDSLGLVNQMVAQKSNEVWLTCVGLPLRLKPPGHWQDSEV